MHGSTKVTIDEAVKRYCRMLKQRPVSEITIRNYRSDLASMVKLTCRIPEQFDLDQFIATGIEPYRRILAKSFRKSTANRKLGTLRGFLEWASESGLIKASVPRVYSVRATEGTKVRARWLNAEEQKRLLRAVISAGVVRDNAIISVMLSTGIRTSELCELRWDDVEIHSERSSLRVHRRSTDTYVTFQLDSFARPWLGALGYEKYRGSREKLFVGRSGGITRRSVEMIVKHYAKLAGLQEATPLTLRNTYIANMVLAGMDLIELSESVNIELIELLQWGLPVPRDPREYLVLPLAEFEVQESKRHLPSRTSHPK